MARAARATVTPARASLYSGWPARFTAEYIGGVCVCGPRKRVRSASSVARSGPGTVGARRQPGARLGGGRRGGAGTVAGNGAVDEAAQAGRALDAFIEHEFQPGRVPQRQPPAKLPAQEPGGVGESDAHLVRRVARGERGEEHARRAHVGRDADRGDGHVAHARILHFARDQRREHTLDLRLDALGAGLRHYCSVLATSTRAKHSIWSLTRTSW